LLLVALVYLEVPFLEKRSIEVTAVTAEVMEVMEVMVGETMEVEMEAEMEVETGRNSLKRRCPLKLTTFLNFQ
jgi:hypothetical protein